MYCSLPANRRRREKASGKGRIMVSSTEDSDVFPRKYAKAGLLAGVGEALLIKGLVTPPEVYALPYFTVTGIHVLVTVLLMLFSLYVRIYQERPHIVERLEQWALFFLCSGIAPTLWVVAEIFLHMDRVGW